MWSIFFLVGVLSMTAFFVNGAMCADVRLRLLGGRLAAGLLAFGGLALHGDMPNGAGRTGCGCDQTVL